GGESDEAGAELPLDSDHSGRSHGGSREESGPEGKNPVDGQCPGYTDWLLLCAGRSPRSGDNLPEYRWLTSHGKASVSALCGVLSDQCPVARAGGRPGSCCASRVGG